MLGTNSLIKNHKCLLNPEIIGDNEWVVIIERWISEMLYSLLKSIYHIAEENCCLKVI